MDSTKLNDWMQVVGLFALVASLIFVGFQIRQDRSIAVVESMASRADAVSELADMVGNNEDLWIRGLTGVELSVSEQATFHAMTEAVESHFVSMWRRYQDIGGGPPENSPTGDYAFALYTHIGLRRAWNNQLAYWEARDAALGVEGTGRVFREEVAAHLVRFDKQSPPRSKEKRYVFW
jgi:hypothetical protein